MENIVNEDGIIAINKITNDRWKSIIEIVLVCYREIQRQIYYEKMKDYIVNLNMNRVSMIGD